MVPCNSLLDPTYSRFVNLLIPVTLLDGTKSFYLSGIYDDAHLREGEILVSFAASSNVHVPMKIVVALGCTVSIMGVEIAKDADQVSLDWYSVASRAELRS